MSDDHTYLEQLERSLRRRGLVPDQTTAVIREITDHLAQSGERPIEAFGEPEQYAAALVAADQPEGDPSRDTRRAPSGPPPPTRWRSSATSVLRAGS